MRRFAFIALMTCLLDVTSIPAQEAPDAPVDDTKRAEESLESARNEVQKFAFHFETDPDKEFFLNPQTVFRATNPVRGEVYANWFVWTHQGRPEVIASVSTWYSPRRYRGLAATSLSPEKLVGTRDGQEIWHPRRPGVEFRPVPEATPPKDTSALRLTQMRALAREFTAEFSRKAREPEGGKLRLLSQPLFRYGGTGEELQDGAIFAFVNGTAPQLALLIEARRASTGLRWEYALAPMNSTAFKVAHRETQVWSLPQIAPPWRNSQHPTNVFTVFPDLTDEGRTAQFVDRLAEAIESDRASDADPGSPAKE